MGKETISSMPWWYNGQQIKTNRNYTIEYDTIQPDYVVPAHWHDYIEFQIVIAGLGYMNFNGVDYRLSRGAAFILSHFDCHRVVSAGEGLRIVTINVSHEFIDERTASFLNTSGGGVCCKLNEKDLEHILYECENLLKDLNSTSPVVIHKNKITISNIALFLLRNNVIASGQIPGKIQRITSYINKNFDKDLSLESIAKEFETSANYLGKQFKNLLGITYNDYINRVRMRFACNLISSTDMSMKEIAHAAGYSSTEYFYSMFKKTIGVTPKVYRKERI